VLRAAAAADEGPLPIEEVRRRLSRSPALTTVRACIGELERLHLVAQDPRKGVLWVLHEDPEFWAARGYRAL